MQSDRITTAIAIAAVFLAIPFAIGGVDAEQAYDMDRYFCGDVEKWVQCVSDRLRAYAKQYVEQHNSMNGFSGDEPLPPNVIFEGVVKF